MLSDQLSTRSGTVTSNFVKKSLPTLYCMFSLSALAISHHIVVVVSSNSFWHYAWDMTKTQNGLQNGLANGLEGTCLKRSFGNRNSLYRKHSKL